MSSTLIRPRLASSTPALPPHRDRTTSAPGGAMATARVWLRRHLSRLQARRVPPLQLEFPDRSVRFRGMKEFEFALTCRSEFPATRLESLIAMTPAQLERAAQDLRDAERCFSGVLARSVHEPGLIGEFFREIEPKMFSQDHGWREIMEGLVRLGPDFDVYKREALIKYMQYLRARQNILRSVFLEKTRGDTTACMHATRRQEDAAAPGCGDTAIFDLGREAVEEPVPSGDYATLPKGATVRIDLGGARELEVILAGNRFRVYTGREAYMVDAGNNTYPLYPGKNLVGRYSGCDVVVDSACRSVSRNHLIVDVVSARELLLTDLSSHGTEVPARYIASR